MNCSERITLRIDNNLKIRVRLLAFSNYYSMNKMLKILIELGYQTYIERYGRNTVSFN